MVLSTEFYILSFLNVFVSSVFRAEVNAARHDAQCCSMHDAQCMTSMLLVMTKTPINTATENEGNSHNDNEITSVNIILFYTNCILPSAPC